MKRMEMMMKPSFLRTACAVAVTLLLSACNSDSDDAAVPQDPQGPEAATYYDRDKIDIANLRTYAEGLMKADLAIMQDSFFDSETKWKMYTYQMILAQSRHFQARGAYHLYLTGVPLDEIKALWDDNYLDSIEDPLEKSAFTYISLAANLPARVTADTHADLRSHFIDRQIAELMAFASVNAAQVVYSQILAIPTDQETADWAEENLTDVGWEIGKHVGTAKEQRKNAMVGDRVAQAYAEVMADYHPEDPANVAQFQTDWLNLVTGYDIPANTYDSDGDGIEDPFDYHPTDASQWKAEGQNDENTPVAGSYEFDVTAFDTDYRHSYIVPESQASFSERHNFDLGWLRRVSALGTTPMDQYAIITNRAMSVREKWPMFLVQQISSNCVHCQVHAAYGMHLEGFSLEQITDMWDFERADWLTERQKVLYRFAREAGKIPGNTTAAHIEELRQHYTNREIQEIFAVSVQVGYLATYMQSQHTATDDTSMLWALENLTTVEGLDIDGSEWGPTTHLGYPGEQRPYYMTEMHPGPGGAFEQEAQRLIAQCLKQDETMTEPQCAETVVVDPTNVWMGMEIPLDIDPDGDGVELAFDGFGADPLLWQDTDGDGIEDAYDSDIDGDGILNEEERQLGTYPYKANSDGDCFDDLEELNMSGRNPLVHEDELQRNDHDGQCALLFPGSSAD